MRRGENVSAEEECDLDPFPLHPCLIVNKLVIFILNSAGLRPSPFHLRETGSEFRVCKELVQT